MFNLLHSNTNQELFERIKIATMKNMDGFHFEGKPSHACAKSTHFPVSKDEWDTKEDTGKSMKNALYVLRYRKVGLLSACTYNFRRNLFVKIILSDRRVRLINNYGECNTESLRCDRVVNTLYRSPRQYVRIFDSIFG